jgi:hypothetical protein
MDTTRCWIRSSLPLGRMCLLVSHGACWHSCLYFWTLLTKYKRTKLDKFKPKRSKRVAITWPLSWIAALGVPTSAKQTAFYHEWHLQHRSSACINVEIVVHYECLAYPQAWIIFARHEPLLPPLNAVRWHAFPVVSHLQLHFCNKGFISRSGGISGRKPIPYIPLYCREILPSLPRDV